jgi:hypothetical protein
MRFERGRRPLWLCLAVLLLTFLSGTPASAAEIRKASEPVRDRYIVTVARDTADVEAVAKALAAKYEGRILAIWKHAVKGFWIEMHTTEAARLAKDARVVTIEQDAILHNSASGETLTGSSSPQDVPDVAGCSPADPLWHLTRISHRFVDPSMPVCAERAVDEEGSYYKYSYSNDGSYGNGSRVKVYLIDTGVWAAHPAELLGATITPGWNAASTPDYNSNGLIALPAPVAADPSSPIAPCNGGLPVVGNTGHGTGTASMIVGRNVGVAKGVELVSVTSVSCTAVDGTLVSRTSVAVLIGAFDYVKSVAEPPAVVSISTFREVCSSDNPGCAIANNDLAVLESVVNSVVDGGIPVFASANNQNRDACRGTPARLSRRSGRLTGTALGSGRTRVITVGGIDRGDRRWEESETNGSNYGQCVDIFAPAADLALAYPYPANAAPRQRYASGILQSGTSYSAPIVAAMAARLMSEDHLLWEVADRSTIADLVWDRLKTNASRFAPPNLGVASPPWLAYLGGVTFTAQPPALTIVPAGQPFHFSVSVVQDPAVAGTYAYQWYRGSTRLTEPTSHGSTFDGIAGNGTIGEYWVRVTHTTGSGTFYGDSTRARVELGLCAVPAFVTEPVTEWIVAPVAGQKAAFLAKANYATNVRYQWLRILANGTTTAQLDPSDPAVTTPAAVPTDGIVRMEVPVSSQPLPKTDTPPTFRVVLTPAAACGDSWKVESDTAQIRTCAPPATPQLSSISVADLEQITLKSGVDPVNSQVRWYFAPIDPSNPSAPPTTLVPLRIEDLTDTEILRNGGAKWATMETADLRPPKSGWYAVKALNSCGESELSISIRVLTTCPFVLTGKINTDPVVPRPADLFRTVNYGTICTLKATILQDSQTVPSDIHVSWAPAGTPVGTDGLIINTQPVTGSLVYTVTAVDQRAQCTQIQTYHLNAFPAQTCPFTLSRTVSDPTIDTSRPDGEPLDVPYGREFKLGVAVVGSQPNLSYAWTGGASVTSELLTGPITQETTFIVAVTDTVNGCVQSARWTFRPFVKAPENCQRKVQLTPKGICSSSDAPVILASRGEIVTLQTYIRVEGEAVPDAVTADPLAFVLSNFHFGWRKKVGTTEWTPMPESGRGIDNAVARYTVTAEPADVELTVTTPEGCQFRLTYRIVPNLTKPECIVSATRSCTYNCGRRHAVRTLSGETTLWPFTPGDLLVMSAPEQAAGSFSYSWYRTIAGTSSTIGNTPDVTVTLDVPAEYWVVTTNLATGEESESEHLLAVLSSEHSALVTVNPKTRTLTAGQAASFTATFTGANADTQYEWREGDRYDRLSAPIIGRSPTVTITDMQENAIFWCRVIQPSANGSVAHYNSEFVTVIVNCTNGVNGVVIARPDRVARGQRPLLLPGGEGKLLTYTWTRSYPDDSTPVFISDRMNPKPEITQPVTFFSATAVDVCGQSGDFGSVTVFLCIPTITAQPTGRLEKAPSYPDAVAPTLTVAATPAVDGQPLTVKWYRAADTEMATPLFTGTTFTAPVPAGSTDSFFAAITSTCGVLPNVVRSEPATVEVCAEPAISSPVTTYQGYAGVPTTMILIGSSAYTYQWYAGDSGNTSTALAGETDRNLTKSPAVTTRYWCRATNRGLCTKDSPTYTLEICSPPVITAQPQSPPRAFTGTPVTISVAATPAASTYQWYIGSPGDPASPISGATAASLTVAPAAETSYWVRITNSICTTDSAAATVTLCSYEPVITLPATRNIAYGESTTLPFPSLYPLNESKAITWYRGASGVRTTPVSYSLSASSLAFTTPVLTASTSYWMEFTHNGCLSTSTATMVTVCKPTISASPAGTTIAAGSAATLSVTTTPIAGQTFQWYVGAAGTTTSPVAGATSASLTVSPTATTSYWVRVKGTCVPDAFADSAAATVIVCNQPAISSVSPTQFISSGQQTAVMVTASGSNPTYQWYIGTSGTTTSPIAGATSPLRYVSPTTTTSYWCRVTADGLCVANGSTIVVDVCTPPSITNQPAPSSIFSGSTATLTVVASSPRPLSYQWYRGPSGDTSLIVAGATASTLTVSPTADTSYWCRVTASVCTVDSAAATISMCVYAPVVNATVATQSVASGDRVTLTLPAMSPVLEKTITWYQGASGIITTPVHTATGTTLNYMTPPLTANAQYWAEFTHNGCVSRTTTYTINVCKPTITSHPQSSTILSGAQASLSAAATGSPLTWQWYIGSSGNTAQPVAGATANTYAPSPASTTTYWVRVTGCSFTADSNAATVTVCTTPAVTNLTRTTNYAIGGTGSITVTATGANLTYQWYKGQSGDTTVPIANATTATYSFTLQNSAYYWVRVGTTCSGATANSAAILYNVAAHVVAYPADVTIPRGTSTTLTVSATGTYLTYQWFTANGSPIAGATSSTFTTPALSVNTLYSVTVGSGTLAGPNGPQTTITMCDGPSIVGFTNTTGAYYTFTVNVAVGDRPNARYFWYRGTPGNTAQSTSLGELTAVQSFSSTTEKGTYWVRVFWTDLTCYTDTIGRTIP